MKLIKSFLMAFVVVMATPSFADQYGYGNYGGYADQPVNANQPSAAVRQEPDGVDIMADIGLRFVGFLGTVVGTALYVAVSPFTAISQMQPPHNSFQKLGEIMVVQPAKYTFVRPIGEYSYGEGRY